MSTPTPTPTPRNGNKKDKGKSGSTGGSNKNSREGSLVNSDLHNSELFRILMTYTISLFVCISLVLGNYGPEYKDSYGKVILISLLFYQNALRLFHSL